MPAALLLIDFQKDFIDPGGRLPIGAERAARLVPAVDRLLALAPSAGLAPVVVASAFRRWDLFANISRRWSALAGSEGARLHPVAERGFPAFAKTAGDAFTDPRLEPYLRNAGFAEVALAGVYAEYCIQATAASALGRGFRVRVIAEAVESDSDANRQKGLDAMRRMGAVIQPLA